MEFYKHTKYLDTGKDPITHSERTYLQQCFVLSYVLHKKTYFQKIETWCGIMKEKSFIMFSFGPF